MPLALRLTDCAEPLMTAEPIGEAPLEPRTMLRLLGLALIEKSSTAAAVTVSPTRRCSVLLGPVPVTVIVYVPAAVPEPTAIVIVEEFPAVTEAGLKLTVVPDGTALAL